MLPIIGDINHVSRELLAGGPIINRFAWPYAFSEVRYDKSVEVVGRGRLSRDLAGALVCVPEHQYVPELGIRRSSQARQAVSR